MILLKLNFIANPMPGAGKNWFSIALFFRLYFSPDIVVQKYFAPVI